MHDSVEVYDSVGEMPALIGGMEALAANVVYPDEAAQEGVEGRVYVQFVVSADGTANDLVCPRSPDDRLCAAAIAAVEASAFTPGRHLGEAVAVRTVLPVTFRLPEPIALPALPQGVSLNDPDRCVPRETEDGEVIEVNPQLIGGIAGLQMQVEYPEMARREGVQGTVFVQFVLDEIGTPSEIFCARSPDDRLCAAAISAIESSRFTPGYQKGCPVKVRFTVPVRFRLN
ncbi:MAG: energy transducer TonB [Bacteroidota bacterium]